MKNCKLCGFENIYVSKQINSPVNPYSYSLYICKSCHSAFFDSKEHPVDLQEIYDDIVDIADYQVEFKQSKKWLQEKRLIERLLQKEPQTILDVGCRTGDFLLHFSDNTEKNGVEVSKNFSKIAKQRGLKIYNDFLENIDFQSSFDVISCYAILEHLENPLIFLESLATIVNEKGLLVIMIPYYKSLKVKLMSFINKQWHMYYPPLHLVFYSRKFLDNYLKQKGFKLVKRSYQSGGMLFFRKGFLSKIENMVIQFIDKSFLSGFPIFDHMYSYYIKK